MHYSVNFEFISICIICRHIHRHTLTGVNYGLVHRVIFEMLLYFEWYRPIVNESTLMHHVHHTHAHQTFQANNSWDAIISIFDSASMCLTEMPCHIHCNEAIGFLAVASLSCVSYHTRHRILQKVYSVKSPVCYMFAEPQLKSFESHSYLTGTTPGKPRWHLANMSDICNKCFHNVDTERRTLDI